MTDEPEEEIAKAPWTNRQCVVLQRFQHHTHCYVCPKHPELNDHARRLFVHRDFLYCERCNYRQDWVYKKHLTFSQILGE